MSCRCYIVPPHLLRAIAESTSNPENVRKTAEASIAARERVTTIRHDRFAALAQPRGFRSHEVNFRPQGIVPDALLRHVANSELVDEATRSRAQRDLEHLQQVLSRVAGVQQDETAEQQTLAAGKGKDKKTPKESPYRAVYDMKHSFKESGLPGTIVRAEGEKPVEDKAVNEAYDNVGTVLQFYKEKFNWKSIDNQNMDVISSVHFGKGYENAFWDPEKLQMVFGDGDTFLNNFTGCIDVIGHEMTHAVTEHTSPLDYNGQPGALNEHVSDVFGIMVKQMVQNETSEKAATIFAT